MVKAISLSHLVHDTLTLADKRVFTLTEPETDTERETNKMATTPNGIRVSVQYEHLHTILYKPFFVSLSIGLSLCRCEQTVKCSMTVSTQFYFSNVLLVSVSVSVSVWRSVNTPLV